jgi:rod shape-determining protein MreC
VLGLLKRYRELILVAILLVVPLGVFFAHAKQPTERSRLDRAIVWLAVPVEKAVGWAVSRVVSVWDGYVALRGAHDRASELTAQVRSLELERQQLLAERAEAERLRSLLAFAELSPERSYLGARIIGVRLGTVGRQLLTIDRGSDDGIARMMPVVVAEGVVGRVQTVAGRSAEVLVLTDGTSSIAVRVDRTRARANVRGMGKPDLCKLEYALRTEEVSEGDTLVTSGTDGVFPRGLPVGKVTQLTRMAHGLFQDARVVPAVDVTRLEEVLVVTTWERSAEAMPAAYAPATGTPSP